MLWINGINIQRKYSIEIFMIDFRTNFKETYETGCATKKYSKRAFITYLSVLMSEFMVEIPLTYRVPPQKILLLQNILYLSFYLHWKISYLQNLHLKNHFQHLFSFQVCCPDHRHPLQKFAL